MDSKLKRTAITTSLLVVLVLLFVVVFVNNREPSPPAPQVVKEEPEMVPMTDGQIGNDLSAFLRDNTFFDPERNPVLEAAKNRQNLLALEIHSVEKDLRIQIVDTDRVPVTGESFYISLGDRGEYKDLDKDGVIYICDLEPGDYYVSLLPIEGYKVPLSEMRVRVKEKVEYTLIEDIDLLIQTEDEVDTETEDTGQTGAAADRDKTEIKKLQRFAGKTQLGIDVSDRNGEIDWDKVKNAGVEFAVIRLGYRGSTSGNLVLDAQFENNMRGAQSAGIQVGAYFFSQATTEVEAVEEASMVAKVLQEHRLDYPAFLGIGDAKGRADSLDAKTRGLLCQAFLRTLQNMSIETGVYAGRDKLGSFFDEDFLSKTCVWLSEYRSIPLYQGYYRMWQYTSNAKVDGIKGKVNANVLFE